MSHLDEGQLRAYFDGQLSPAESAHLTTCSHCQEELTGLKSRAARMSARLAVLTPLPAEAPRPAQHALDQLKTRINERKDRTPMLNSLFTRRLRPVWAGLALVAALTVAFSFAPMRAWAVGFLGLFRVQNITVVEFDPANLDRYSQFEGAQTRLDRFFSENVVQSGGGDPQVVASPAEAAQVAGYALRLPGNLGEPASLVVQPGVNIAFEVDLNRVHAILDELGRSDIRLPKALDGETVTVNLPTSVATAYGSCPQPASGEAATAGAERDHEGRVFYRDCKALVQLPSPTINAPDGLDLAVMGQAMLEFTGMSPEKARQFSANVDWTTTLVIPVPSADWLSYREVSVDGVTGTLITDNNRGGPGRYTLLWVKDGVVYSLMGSSESTDEALEIANSLQ